MSLPNYMEYMHPSGVVLGLVYAVKDEETGNITARFESPCGNLWANTTSTREWTHVEVNE